MTATNFKNLLRKNLDDVKKPEPVPEGSYRGKLLSYSMENSARKGTPYVRFQVGLREALEGVDTDELKEALQGAALETKKLRKDFYMTDEALYRLKDFFKSLSIEIQGRSIEECLVDTKDQEVLVEVTKRPSEDGKEFYNDVKEMSGLGD